jgi:transcriptional regulator with XRE-family HTH domain
MSKSTDKASTQGEPIRARSRPQNHLRRGASCRVSGGSAGEQPKPVATPPSANSLTRHLGRRVKHLRTERGWSLEVLAGASGVSRSMLSQIERERANPTLAVTLRIAQAFGLALGELLETPGAASTMLVVRAEDHAYHYRTDKDCRIRTLSPLNLEKDVEFYEVRLGPGGALRSSPHFEGTREFLTVQKGRLRVESGGGVEELNTGDSASYRADVPHAIINAGKSDATVYLIVIYR